MYLLFCFFIFISRLAYSGEIITANNLCCIEEKIEKLDSRNLVLWDVDGTLIAPDDAILQLKGRKLFNRLIGEYSTDRDLFREVRLKAPHSLVDIRILDLVQKLRAKNIPSIAFTAAPAKINNLQQPGDWRVEELKRFGLDFRYSFIDRNFLELPKNSDQSHFPLFKSGVLYSSLHPKGDVLTVFLHLMDLIPSKVILIDDELHHLQSVMASLEKMGIPSLGIHFTPANAFSCELNPEVARFQIDYFVKHDVWLNDQECQNMLKGKH